MAINYPKTTDVTFAKSRTDDPILIKNTLYLKSVIQNLFFQVPGTDYYDIRKGLNLVAKIQKPYSPYQRDSEYESDIMTQFNTYTDIRVVSVNAIFDNNKVLNVSMKIIYDSTLYTVLLGYENNTLTSQIALANQ